MTPERLAKVAEVLAGHVARYHGGSGHAVCDCGGWEFWGSLPDFMRATQEHQAEMLAPLLDEFQAEDEARGAARVRESVEALCDEAMRRPIPGYVSALQLRAALDAAEKAAVGGANRPLAAERAESGSQDVRDAAGLSGAHSDVCGNVSPSGLHTCALPAGHGGSHNDGDDWRWGWAGERA